MTMTWDFHASLPFPTATETFLNEQESAAMPGMSLLPTVFSGTHGTSIQVFHIVH